MVDCPSKIHYRKVLVSRQLLDYLQTTNYPKMMHYKQMLGGTNHESSDSPDFNLWSFMLGCCIFPRC